MRLLIMPALRALPFPLVLFGLAVSAPSAQPPDSPADPLWRVRPAQALLGAFGGAVGAVLGGVAGFLLTPPCISDGIVEASSARAALQRPCGGFGLPAGLALGAIAGSSGGIYAVGRNGGGEGSFLATAGGSAAGLAAGIALAVTTRPKGEIAFALITGTTTLSGLAAYHLTDRVRISAGPLPGVQVTLMRF